MKQWPKDKTITLSAEDVINPLIAVYRKVMKNPEKDHKYTGYEVGRKERVHVTLNDLATISNLKYHAERDRDVHYMFLLSAFQLGMEQGRRTVNEFQKSTLRSLESDLKLINGKKELPQDILDIYVEITKRHLEILKLN